MIRVTWLFYNVTRACFMAVSFLLIHKTLSNNTNWGTLNYFFLFDNICVHSVLICFFLLHFVGWMSFNIKLWFNFEWQAETIINMNQTEHILERYYKFTVDVSTHLFSFIVRFSLGSFNIYLSLFHSLKKPKTKWICS